MVTDLKIVKNTIDLCRIDAKMDGKMFCTWVIFGIDTIISHPPNSQSMKLDLNEYTNFEGNRRK